MPKLGMVIDGFYGLVEVFPEATMWMDSLKIKRASYHGAQFEGRECDVLLENIDGLQNIVANSNFTPCVTRSSTAQALQHPAEPFIKLFLKRNYSDQRVSEYDEQSASPVSAQRQRDSDSNINTWQARLTRSMPDSSIASQTSAWLRNSV